MRTYVLIDARHGPLKADLELVQLIRGCGVPYQLLLTKVDLCSPTELRASLAKTTPIMSMSGCFPVEILTSSKTGTGLEELKATIALLA
jgi:GTP-binding protein